MKKKPIRSQVYYIEGCYYIDIYMVMVIYSELYTSLTEVQLQYLKKVLLLLYMYVIIVTVTVSMVTVH